jgi:acetoacetyl-CoA synthetase
MGNNPIWSPSEEDVLNTNLFRLQQFVNRKKDLDLKSYSELHKWSIDHSDQFWSVLWDYCGVIGDKGERLLVDGDKLPGAQFFPDALLNYAENLLRRRDDSDALLFWGEDRVKTHMSWNELYDAVSCMAQALKGVGIEPGDRIAAYLPNIPEAIVSVLAVSSLGAIWSSCSPDFGEQGVLDRFGQIEPKVLIAADGYFYNGKVIDNLSKLAGVVNKLPTLETVVVVPFMRRHTDQTPDVGDVDKAVLYADFTERFSPAQIEFKRLPFNHPLYILFSSGTTGVPKCIVHGAGGTLIQHMKEHQLHCDLRPDDRLFYFTTCTWMMWNWLVSGLASEAILLLYDGSPFYPDGNILFDLADAEQMTHFGTAAKFIDTLKKRGLHPKETHELSSLRVMTSTGSPLVAESFDFVYDNIKSDLYLASISGGTDIISCFVLGNPTSPLYRGEIACCGLGMAVEVWDEEGNSIKQEKGELVCLNPFPSMPVGFWNDPENTKYKKAYFEHFENVWAHGDFAEITDNEGVIIYGRSDATLNPGGVRIGTAEIYRQVEQMDEILESIVIGQNWDGDVRVVLFVVLRDGESLTEELVQAIRRKIRWGASPRHVPAKIVAVTDIPRTKSGKITELAVRDAVEGREVKNAEALANPEALEFYKDIEALKFS